MCLYKCFFEIERESLESTMPSSNQFLETVFISSEVYMFIFIKEWNVSTVKWQQA